MIIDFQHHYTPPELMERGGSGILRLDEYGNPNYRFNPLLADLPAHVRMMDRAGIDVAVLSCGSGFDHGEAPVDVRWNFLRLPAACIRRWGLHRQISLAPYLRGSPST
jgi:hypothetical protein